jgi:putative acetyltransferase
MSTRVNKPRMEIRVDDLSSPAPQALVRLHLAQMHANSPPGHAFALDHSGLQGPGVTLWSAWAEDEILGMGALKRFDAGSGEVKCMRTHPDHLRRGVASALLEHIHLDGQITREDGRGGDDQQSE